MSNKIPSKFIGEVVGIGQQVTPEITKARLRIFYKGLNRNGGYITDEFADKLLQSLPYAPVVGIYNELTKEFGGHAYDRNAANMYGVVPENPNFAWEDNLDKDGIIRTYACTDVYLYTGRYEAAQKIVGKQQSMELDEKSIQGRWVHMEGNPNDVFLYENARFIGLSVLGDDKEPCFEGSAFFSLVEKFNNFMLAANNQDGGIGEMALANSEETKTILGQNDNSESETFIEESVPEEPDEDGDDEEEGDSPEEDGGEEDLADSEKKEPGDCVADDKKEDPAADNEVKKEDEPADSAVEDKKPTDCVSEEDKSKEEPADSACGDDKKDYVDENPEDKPKEEPTDSACGDQKKDYVDEKPEKPEDKSNSSLNFEILERENLELKNQVSTLQSEADKYKNMYTALKKDFDVLNAEKQEHLSAQKTKKLNEYKSYLGEAVWQDFELKLDSYDSVDTLEKDLLFAAKPNLFAKQDNFAPTSFEQESDDLAALIRKSKKH